MRDKVVVITGASRGIGAELARQLAKDGATLALSGREVPLLEQVASECKALGARAQVFPADVAMETDCRRLVEHAATSFGRIDVLVNNAGATMWGRFDEISDLSILERIMDVNYMGAVRCTHYALPHLKRSGGLIVGVASLTGLTGVPTRTGYAASKHAMRGFFDSLRIELEGSGVDVTMAYPGFVATGIRENANGPGGKPAPIDPVDPKDAMSPEECARLIREAMAGRKREVVMTLKGKMGPWLKLVAPSMVDGLAKRAIETGR